MIKKTKKNQKRKSYLYPVVFTVLLFTIIFITNCSSNAGGQSEGRNIKNNESQADMSKEGKDNTIASNIKATDLDEKNFENTIKKGVVLVDFWAPWCGPCRTQGPIVDELAKEIGSKAVIAKVNVDNNNNISNKYEVRNIPTIILFKDGKPAMRFVGVQEKSFLIQQIEDLL